MSIAIYRWSWPKGDEATVQELCSMALCCEGNTGKAPMTLEELAQHWVDIGYESAGLTDGPTLFQYDLSHLPQCMWLFDLLKRSDQDALFDKALSGLDAAREKSRQCGF
jgi:hypothetical protein